MPFEPGRSGNPKGRPRSRFDATTPQDLGVSGVSIARQRADGWFNMLTSLGTTAKDKRRATRFCTDIMSYPDMVELYRGDDLAKRIVNTPVEGMVRAGFELKIQEDADGNDQEGGKELSDLVAQRWQEMGVIETLVEAMKYERAYGGGAILLGINDGQDLSMPLDMDRVISFDWLTALEPRELFPVAWYENERGPKFGKPALYQLAPMRNGTPYQPAENDGPPLLLIHESRLITFRGERVTRVQQFGTLPGWGDSIFVQVIRILQDFNVSWGAAGVLVSEFAQPVFKIEDLAKIMAEDNKQLFGARMAAVALARSTCNTVLIDKNEEYKREQTPVTGLPDLLDRFARRLAAAADQPFEVLFGESPGGLNPGGGSDNQTRLWYDRLAAKRDDKVIPPLRVITTAILMLLGGVPKKWSVIGKPLWQTTEKEQVETKKLQSEIDCQEVDRGILTVDEVRRNRYEGKEYSYNTHVEAVALDEDLTPEEIAAYKAEKQGAAPGADPKASGSQDIQKQAMNGAQITSLLEVVNAVNDKSISRDSGRAILTLAFQLTGPQADEVLGPKNFEPAKPEPPTTPAPFGGGAPPIPGKVTPPPEKLGAPLPVDKSKQEQSSAEPKSDQYVADYVREVGGKWIVYSEAGKPLGEYPNEHAANERLREIEAAKAAKA